MPRLSAGGRAANIGALSRLDDMMDFILNGQPQRLALAPDYPLLDALRQHLGLHSVRLGCGQEQCGTCHVLIDGRSVPTCNSSVDRIAGRQVTTIEAGRDGCTDAWQPILHALQQAFVVEEAAQCGYCTSGLIITAAALLAAEPAPDAARVRTALDGHLCRCGAHGRIVRAVLRAAQQLREVRA